MDTPSILLTIDEGINFDIINVNIVVHGISCQKVSNSEFRDRGFFYTL
jgi:hypothetical protein